MVLSREKYMEMLKTIIGEDTNENTLQILEDFTDTFDSLNSQPPEIEDYKTKLTETENKYNDLQLKYKTRFFESSHTEPIEPIVTEPVEPTNPDSGGPLSELISHE